MYKFKGDFETLKDFGFEMDTKRIIKQMKRDDVYVGVSERNVNVWTRKDANDSGIFSKARSEGHRTFVNYEFNIEEIQDLVDEGLIEVL